MHGFVLQIRIFPFRRAMFYVKHFCVKCPRGQSRPNLLMLKSKGQGGTDV